MGLDVKWRLREPTPRRRQHVVGRIHAVLDDSRTEGLVRDYYLGQRWAGGWFDRFAKDEHGPHDIGCHDLLALTLLDVCAPATATRDILFDRSVRTEVTERLIRVPIDKDLWKATEGDLLAANELWTFLATRQWKGMSSESDARLSKLLARKRPRMIPITDSVISEYLGDGDLWSDFWFALQPETGIREQLRALQAKIGAVDDISTLRVLDAALWMHESGQAQRYT